MKSFHPFPLLFALVVVVAGCKESKDPEETYGNPPAEGFNREASDEKAIKIADSVMEAMGGRKNLDATRYLCWNFFGARELIWDKQTGDVRIDAFNDSTTWLMNIQTMEGKVQVKGEEITAPDSLANMLDLGKRIWINDSYWLLMPYKLKDTGVTLKYLGVETTQAGEEADVLQLTFDDVGVTPENKYKVWVDQETNLVCQWAYYRYDTLQEPGFITPWKGWKKHGGILLSGNRGERHISNIHVLEEIPESVFTSFEPVDVGAL